MFTAVAAALPPFKVVFGSKHNKPLLIVIIVLAFNPAILHPLTFSAVDHPNCLLLPEV